VVILSLLRTLQPFADSWLCFTNRLSVRVPLSPDSFILQLLSEGYAKRGEAVQNGHTDLELSYLTVKVQRSQTLAEQFDTVHFRFDAAPAVIAAPSSLNRPA